MGIYKPDLLRSFSRNLCYLNKSRCSTFAKSIAQQQKCVLSSTKIYSRSINFLVLLGLYKIHQNEDEPTHTQKYNVGPSSKKQTK